MTEAVADSENLGTSMEDVGRSATARFERKAEAFVLGDLKGVKLRFRTVEGSW